MTGEPRADLLLGSAGSRTGLSAEDLLRARPARDHLPGRLHRGRHLSAIYLKTRDRRWDMRSYVTIHMSIIFAVGTLITGSIWAKGSWGHWWVWNEPELVSFLIVFLLYCCYQPLRFSIEDPDASPSTPPSSRSSPACSCRCALRPCGFDRLAASPGLQLDLESALADVAHVPDLVCDDGAAVHDPHQVRADLQARPRAAAPAAQAAGRRERGSSAARAAARRRSERSRRSRALRGPTVGV